MLKSACTTTRASPWQGGCTMFIAPKSAIATMLTTADILVDLDVPTRNLVRLVPQHATDAHLLLLAQVAEMFCDESLREELHACADAAAIHAAFAQWRPA